MNTSPNRTIRGYDLLEKIGEGAYGAVYRARQETVDREVAVKIVLPEYANRPDFIRRFESEAQLVAQLEHLHIVPLYDYWRDPEGAYLVMRLMKGGSLEQLIQKGALPLAQVTRVLEQVASALTAAHRRGIVHRDIKPANILLDEEGNAYLSDFGIAKALGEESGMTVTGAIVGTPAYITPEQVQSLPVSPQTDIYTLGVLLYVMLTGEHPFPEASPGDLIAQHLRDPLPRLEEIDLVLPAELDGVIQRATAKDPVERYPDAAELLADFREVLGPEMAPPPARTLIDELLAVSNPFKGLRPFQEADADDFYGREVLTRRLLRRLSEEGEYSRFLAVVGPSGSGKSSVVKAGLIPAIRGGALVGSEKWYITEMVPGTHPLEELELALLRIAVHQPPSLLTQLKEDGRGLLRATRRILPDAAELLLVVDQFEEVFTQAAEKNEARHFMDLTYQAISEPDSPVRVVVTLRADFYDRPLMEPDFSALVQERTEVVVPLTTEELEEAIRYPVEGVGAALDEGLTLTIVRDVIEQPGALPLLQYALTELFEHREGRDLTHKAYQSIGGVLGALGQRAEEVYTGLDPNGQILSRQVFLRLVSLGEGVEDTRRRVLRSELETLSVETQSSPRQVDNVEVQHVASLQTPMESVIESFGRARLLSFDHDPQSRAPTVEVAHEALLREWDRLKEWLNESRADIRMQRVLGAAAQDWGASNQDASFLLRGSRLAQFEGWADETSLALTDQEKLFLQSSLEDQAKRHARRAALERRSRNFLRALVGVLAVAAVIAVVLSIYAFNQQGIAQTEADSRATQQVVAEEREKARATQQTIAEAAQEEAQSMALAESQAREEAERSLRLSTSNELVAFALTELEKLSDMTHSLSLLLAREAVLTTLEADGNVTPQAEATLRQAIDAAPLLVKSLASDDDYFIRTIFWSPDGKKVITVGADTGRTRIWDAESGEELLVWDDRCLGLHWAKWRPDGKKILSTGGGGCISIWDAQSGDEELILQEYSEALADWSPDGTKIAAPISYSEFVIVWDAQTGEPYLHKSMEVESWAVSYSPDGGRIAANSNKSVNIFSSQSGEGELLLEKISTMPARWSQDGSYIMTTPVGYFLIETSGAVDEWPVHTYWESGYWPYWSQDPDWDSRGILGVFGAAAIIWDSQTGEALHDFPHTDIVWSADWSPDESQLVTGAEDGIVRIWDIRTERLLHQWQASNFSHVKVTSVDWSPDGAYILTAGGDGITRIWRIGAQKPLQHPDPVASASWSPDGNRALTVAGRKAFVWDTESETELLRFESHSSTIRAVAWQPNAELVITGDEIGTAIIWDAANGEVTHRLGGDKNAHKGAINSITWDADSNLIVTSGQDNITRIWDADRGEEIRSFAGDRSAALNPDGALIITTNRDGTAKIWDIASGDELRELQGHTESVNDTDWSPDGKYVVTASSDGTARIWDAQTGEEVNQLLGHTGAVLSVEWQPSGHQILTAGADGTARIWNAQTGQEVDQLIGHAGEVSAAAWSPDGMQVLTASSDQTARVWSAGIESLLRQAEERITRQPPEFTPEERCFYLHECEE